MIEAKITFANEDDYAWFLDIMRESKEAGDLQEPFTIQRLTERRSFVDWGELGLTH